MNKVKDGRGGKRPGAGRKPVKFEEGVKAAILHAMAKDPERIDRIWQKIMEKAEKGSFPHQQLLFNYLYGRPTEYVEVRSMQMTVTRTIVNE